MWELDYKESWVLKNWCFWTVMLEKTLQNPLDSKESQKEISPEYSLEWLMLKLKLQYFGHLMQRINIGKDLDAGKDWRQEEKGRTENEMVGWHHRLNGYEFEQTLELVMDREAWHAAVHEVTKSWTWLNNWTELSECYVYHTFQSTDATKDITIRCHSGLYKCQKSSRSILYNNSKQKRKR